METGRTISYAQSRALERANEARRANQRLRARQADQTPQLTAEQTAKWKAERRAALAAYRAKKRTA